MPWPNETPTRTSTVPAKLLAGVTVLALGAGLATGAPAQTTLNVATAGSQNMVDYVTDYLGPMFEAPPARVAELERDRAGRGSSWADLVRPGISEGSALADLLANPAWANEMPASIGLWEIWSTLPQIADLATNPHREQDRAAWSSFAQVLEHVEHVLHRPAPDTVFLSWFQSQDQVLARGEAGKDIPVFRHVADPEVCDLERFLAGNSSRDGDRFGGDANCEGDNP